MAYYNQASQTALNTGQNGASLPWNNPQTGNSGTITPTNYYQNTSGQYCREYNQTINVGGKTERGYGTACRQPDGTWQIVSQ
jgi:surface antigen